LGCWVAAVDEIVVEGVAGASALARPKQGFVSVGEGGVENVRGGSGLDQVIWFVIRSEYKTLTGVLPDPRRGKWHLTRQDSYVFESLLDTRVEDAVASYTPALASGKSATIIDYSPYEDFGTFSLTEPLRQEENGRTYESEWTRMDIVSWNNLGMWRDKLQARRLARNGLRPYLEELQRAPSLRGRGFIRLVR
jgi:hypothetical protein